MKIQLEITPEIETNKIMISVTKRFDDGLTISDVGSTQKIPMDEYASNGPWATILKMVDRINNDNESQMR